MDNRKLIQAMGIGLVGLVGFGVVIASVTRSPRRNVENPVAHLRVRRTSPPSWACS